MRAPLLSTLGALLMVLVGASCAKGTTFTGVGGFGGDGGSASTGVTMTSSGMTGSTSSSSGNTTTSSSGSGSTTSSGTSSSSGCPSPCGVAPQCGCAGGEACTISAGAVGCGQAGTKGEGQACGTSTTDLCQAGFVCVTASAAASQCLEFCNDDADCTSPGGLCLLQLDDGMGGSIANVTICTPNCSLFNNTGCPTGSACELRQESMGQKRWLTLCGEAGTKTQGQPCDQMIEGDCAPTYTCIDPDGFGTVCLKYCDESSPTSCPGGLLCYGLQDQSSQPILLGSTPIGVCYF